MCITRRSRLIDTFGYGRLLETLRTCWQGSLRRLSPAVVSEHNTQLFTFSNIFLASGIAALLLDTASV